MYQDPEGTHSLEQNGGHIEASNKSTATIDTDGDYYKGKITSLNEEIINLNEEIKTLNNKLSTVMIQ